MAAHQAPPSLGFSRQEHWNGLPFPSPMHESEKWKWSRSVMSDPQRPHELQPSRLLRPWDFPGKSTGVGCHCLLQIMRWALCKSSSSVRSLSCVWLFEIPWTAAHQAFLSITNSRSLLKLMSIMSVKPSNHLILFLNPRLNCNLNPLRVLIFLNYNHRTPTKCKTPKR